MRVLVTAGNCSEPVDAVRSITNTSTGRLGAAIAAEFARDGAEVVYLCGLGAVLPPQETSAEIHRVQGVAGLQASLAALLENRRFDCVVHSMAVSDYTVRGTADAADAAAHIAARLAAAWQPAQREHALTDEAAGFVPDSAACAAPGGMAAPNALRPAPGDSAARDSSTTPGSGLPAQPTAEALQPLVHAALLDMPLLPTIGKLGSSMQSPLVLLQQAPKVIAGIKAAQPNTLLVGFKLLAGVSEQELVQAATALLHKNGCTLVLANDMDSIHGDVHQALLLDETGILARPATKGGIAAEIVRQVTARL